MLKINLLLAIAVGCASAWGGYAAGISIQQSIDLRCPSASTSGADLGAQPFLPEHGNPRY